MEKLSKRNTAESMRKSRRLLSVVVVFFWASEYCHVPYFTPYLNMLGFGATAIGVMTGVYGLTQTVARIPLGIATDVTGGYRQVVRMGCVFTTVSSFGLIFAKSSWFIIFCRFLAGIAASTWLAFSVLYSAYYDASEGVEAMTSINVFNNGGKLLAFVLGTITATLWGYRFPLIISFLTGVVAIAAALGLSEAPIHREPMRLSVLGRTFLNPYVLAPALFAVVLQMVGQGTAFSFTSRVAEWLGAGKTWIGVNTALFTLVQVAAGGWLSRHFVKKVGKSIAVAVGFAALGAHCVLIAAAPHFAWLLVAQVIGGAGNILLMSVLMALAIERVPTETKSTAMGLFQAIYGIGMTIGPMLMGHLVEGGSFRSAYLMFGAICGVTALAALALLAALEKRASHLPGASSGE